MSSGRKRPPSDGDRTTATGEPLDLSRGPKGRKVQLVPMGDAGPSQRVDTSHPTGSSDAGSNSDILRSIDLPPVLDLERFVSARKDELANLTEAVKTRMRKLVSQQLPRHLRRRTVSHNRKRLPKRMQDRYNAEAAKETKRPSRLHRRRPRCLQDEYTRRSRKHRWLETHLWHAKRFRMVEKFGYKIPESSFDKSLRACYRGAAKFCLLNDISYECCIELRGEQGAICGAFERISSKKTGLSVGAKKFIDGRYQGSIWLYKVDSYPYQCLGEVSFMWRPEDVEAKERTLWLWCHPEFRETLISTFQSLLDLTPQPKEADSHEPPCFKGATVTLTDLQDELNRFRLTGPLSARVLCETLTQDRSGIELKEPFSLQPDSFNQFWDALGQNALSAFSYLRDGQIAGNVVLDPRLHMPRKRMVSTVVGAQADDEEGRVSRDDLDTLDEVPLRSDIWDRSVRRTVKSTMMTQDQLNKMQHENLVPGTPLDLGAAESRIPILVVFRGGSQGHLGYSRGCDIIIPSGWGRQFFIALNYRSARAAGLRDLVAVTRYSGRFSFPYDVLDSILVTELLDEETNELLHKHLRYPPNKRPPFAKLGVSLPYMLPFAQLIASLGEIPESNPFDFFVLRDRALLKQMSDVYNRRNKLEAAPDWQDRLIEMGKTLPERQADLALIPVKVTCPKGVPRRFARLYGLPLAPGPMQEPVHDTEQPERTVTIEDLSPDTLNATDNLYPLVGFLVSGDRNYTEKCSTGLGYVALKALTRGDHDGAIAFRNLHCFNYYDVRMTILC